MAKLSLLSRINTMAWGLSLMGVMLASLSLNACSNESKADKLHKQGVLLYKNHKYFNAIKKFEESLQIKPENAGALAMAAEAYLQTDKPEIAIEYGTRATDLDPERYSAFLTVGQAHLELAIADRPTTQSIDAESVESQKQMHSTAAARIAQMLREKQPDSPEGLILQARIDTINGQIDAAQRLYQKAVELAPENITAKLGLCDALIIQQQYEEAEKAIRPMVEGEKNPHPGAVTQLAVTLARQQKYAQAFEILKPWISESNVNPVLNQYLLAGDILIPQIQALKNREKELKASSPDGSAELDPLEQAELNSAIDSLATLGGIMKGRYPARPESYYFRAISYEMLDNHEEAVSHFREAIQRAPRSKHFRLALALSLLGDKEYEEARQQLRMILRDRPGDFDARLRMAQCYAGEGSHGEALTLLRDLNREQPNQPAIQEMLGKVLILTEEQENVDEGLELLGNLGGGSGLEPGSSQMVMAQVAIKEARALIAKGQHPQADEKFLKAEDLLRQARELQPRNPVIELKLAELAEFRRDIFSALVHTRRAALLDPQYRPLEARTFSQLGQFEAARNIYEQLLAENSNAIGFKLALADLMVRQGRMEEALQAFNALIESHPTDPQAYLRKADLLARVDRRPEAIDLLNAQAAQFAENVPLQLALARMLLQESRTAESVNHLASMSQTVQSRLDQLQADSKPEEVLTQVRKYLGAIHLTRMMAEILNSNYDNISQQAELTLGFDPLLTSQVRIFQAIALIHQDQAGQAVELINGLKGQEDLPPAFPYLLSLSQLANGDKAGALAGIEGPANLDEDTLVLYRHLVEHNPIEKLKAITADLMLLIYLAERPTYAQVMLKLADQTLQVLPDAPMLLARKAETLQILGLADEALEVYSHMEQVLPDFVPVKIAKARVYKAKFELAQARGEKEEAAANSQSARALLENALQLDPKSLRSLQILADLAQKENDLEKANACYRQTIEIDPANWAAYNNLAWNLSESGNLDEAARIGHTALELVPGVGVVQDTVGWIEFQRDNLDEAEKLLKDASLRIPNNPEVRFHLAQVLAAREKTREAVADLEMLLLATPGFNQIGEVRDLLAKLAPDSDLLR